MPDASLSPAKQLARAKIRGLWIAIPTPFTAAGRLDEDVLAQSIDYYVDGLRVDGIFCGGVMGEFWALTLAERQRVHAIVAERVRGRVPVMAQCGHHALAEAAALCNHAGACGIDFAIVMNPYYPPHPPDALVRHWYTALHAATRIPLVLFNTVYSGYSLAPELIGELADLERVCGIKNPQEREHLLAVQRLAGDRLVVTDAAEVDWLDLHLNHGFQALNSTPALALFQTPENRPVAHYTALADAGEIEPAWAAHSGLAEHRRAFRRWMRAPWLERRVIPIAYLKAWMGMMGLPQGPVRPPLVPLIPDEERALRTDLEALGLLGAIRSQPPASPVP